MRKVLPVSTTGEAGRDCQRLWIVAIAMSHGWYDAAMLVLQSYVVVIPPSVALSWASFMSLPHHACVQAFFEHACHVLDAINVYKTPFPDALPSSCRSRGGISH